MNTFTQAYINKMNLNTVEYWYYQGVITQAQYDIYKDLWLSSFHYCTH